MKHLKKMFFVSIIVTLASQISIGLMSSDFRVSAGIIFFVIFLYYYKELKPIPTGILSGIMVNFLRLIIYYFTSRDYNNTIPSYHLEILFYAFYAIIYSILNDRTNKNNNNIFIVMVISDFCANIIEIFIRAKLDLAPFPWAITTTLFFVAIVRSSIAWFALNLFKYYRMFLLKEEHERRYKRLLWLTSQLKTEMYWMEKNMDNIEKVMSDSYKLFELINLNEDKDSWSDRAVNIARDVHEIKKENGLAVRGIKEIIEFEELKDKGMNFKDIISILFDTMNREIKRLGKDIQLEYNIEENFYTSKHYYLMSIFRNLVMNGIDAIPSTQKDAKISINHSIDKEDHLFIVADNGIGIDEEGLKHIFSPGFSTKINYDTGEVNRGLGLTIIKYIAEEQLDGKVNVISTKGKGTSFYISIPIMSLEANENEDINS